MLVGMRTVTPMSPQNATGEKVIGSIPITGSRDSSVSYRACHPRVPPGLAETLNIDLSGSVPSQSTYRCGYVGVPKPLLDDVGRNPASSQDVAAVFRKSWILVGRAYP